ncbi:MAG: Bax inhibitor-1 family protein [Peptostreptococcaceae bacterium]
MERENYLAIIKTFFMSLVFLVIGSFIGVTLIPPSVRNMLNIAFFILVLFSLFSRRGGFIRTKGSMYGYAFVLGILTGSTYIYYFAILGSDVFLSAVLGVLLIFGLAYIIASKSSEEKVFKMSTMVWSAIVVLLIVEFINIFFFDFGTFDLILSGAGIIIYSVYSIIIMKSIQGRCRYGILSEEEVVQLSYSVFISFLNLLLDLLRLLSIVRDND